MRARREYEAGQSVLYAIVLAPIIFLSLALALEAGALQLQKQRLRSAADMATTSAGATGAVVVGGADLNEPTTEAALRSALEANMQDLAADIDGSSPEAVAETADVYLVVNVPAADPLDSNRTLTRPTIETRMQVPVRSGLLSFAGLPPQVTMTVTSSADLRIVGGAAT